MKRYRMTVMNHRFEFDDKSIQRSFDSGYNSAIAEMTDPTTQTNRVQLLYDARQKLKSSFDTGHTFRVYFGIAVAVAESFHPYA